MHASQKLLQILLSEFGTWILKALVEVKKRLSVTNLSSENNLPTFRLNAPVVIRAKVEALSNHHHRTRKIDEGAGMN